MPSSPIFSNPDLHMHSTHSDGTLSAVELISLAKERGVDCLSITDHDSISVYQDIDSNDLGDINLVVGCEFSAVWRSMTVHVVGLNLDLESDVLKEAINIQSRARIRRSERIAEVLEKKGFLGALGAAQKIAAGAAIGRPHFAQFLVEEGHVKDAQQAFKKYLGAGKVGDIKAEWQSVEQICHWIRDSGGVAVVAHPLKYGLTQTKLRALLEDFKEYGGEAMEVISGCQDTEKTKVLARLADQFQLAASTGSDFHRPGLGWAELGRAPVLPISCTPVWSLWL